MKDTQLTTNLERLNPMNQTKTITAETIYYMLDGIAARLDAQVDTNDPVMSLQDIIYTARNRISELMKEYRKESHETQS